jgi:hypothetical protein
MELNQLFITEKEETGVWFERNGASFLVCSLAKPAYKTAYANKLAEHIRVRRHSTVTPEMDIKFTSELFAEHILVDWKGLTEKGQPLAYSKAKALEYLSNPRMRLLDWVKQWANDEAIFQNNLDAEGVESLKKG